MNNKTLYKRLDEICAREYVVNKLSVNKYRTFVDLLYDDLISWDNPLDVSEIDIIHRIHEHLSVMVSSSLVYPHIGTNHN